MSFRDPTIPNRSAADRRRGLVYPSPFFDVAQSYMPPTVKELLKWCAYFFYTDPLIGSVVYKIAEYPVTDFIYGSEDEHVRDSWKNVMENVLNMKPFLIEIGLDFFTFGNAFISINLPFKRLLQCPHCKKTKDIQEIEYKFKNFTFSINCEQCDQEVEAKVKDIPLKSIGDINFIRWDPKNIDIDFNPLTGKSRYRYRIPNKIRRAIQQGRKETIAEIPWIFIQAVKEKRDIILSKKNLFHFKRPTLAEQDQGWGKPLILHSMKRMFYLYVLRRAQEAIALQRILPLEFIFPQANATQDPYQHVNLSNWSGRVQDEIRKWRCVSPESLVESRDGLIPAGDVRDGDWLKNRNGIFERVTGTNERALDPGEMAFKLRVRGQAAVETVFSEEHPIWAAKKENGGNGHKLGKPEFIRVDELRPGDYVGYPVNREIKETKEIDLAEYTDRVVTEDWVYTDYVDSENPVAFELLESTNGSPDKETWRQYGATTRKVARRVFDAGKTFRRIPRRIPFDKDFAYALGVYAAEGNVTPAQVLYSLHEKETDIVSSLDRFFEKRFGAKRTGGRKPHCNHGVQYAYSSIIAAQLFGAISPGISRTKRLPEIVRFAPDELATEAIRGVIDGDGCFYEDKVTLRSSSVQLAEDVRQILLSLRVMVGISYEKGSPLTIAGKKTHGSGCYTVQASGSQFSKLSALLAGEKYDGKDSCKIGLFRDGFAWFRIKAVEEASAEKVIGISMDGDNTFCTFCIATHNTDPNYISVVPVPLGFERLGGDGRALMLGPEIEIANKEITGGMGVPLEFVFGGLSWSGSSVSLRTLENHFLMYRRLLLRFIDFVKNHLVTHFGLPSIDIKFTEFKMADDIQRKQLVIQLNASQKISDETMLSELGFDQAKEQKKIKAQIDKQMELSEMQMKAQAKAQGEAQIISIKYQTQAQQAQMEAQQQMQEEQASENPEQAQQDPQAQQAQQAQQGGGQPEQQQQQPQGAEAEMAQEAKNQIQGAPAPGGVVKFDVDAIAKKWATRIMGLPPGERSSVLNDLRQRMPNMYGVVSQLIASKEPEGASPDAGAKQNKGQAVDMRPNPEMKPPRRENKSM